MKNIVILTGSVRPNNVSSKVAALVANHMRSDNNVIEIVEVGDLKLPFFDASLPPSSDDYTFPHKSVEGWSNKVVSADIVVFVCPEYNHAMSAVQKNAIDWLYKEWDNKSAAIVAYSWHEGKNVLVAAESLLTTVKANIIHTVGLGFNQEISADGAILDSDMLLDKLNGLSY